MKTITTLFTILLIFQSYSQEFEQVANLNFKLGALGLEAKYFAFDEGDIVKLDFIEQKGKGIKSFDIRLYEGQNIFSKFKPINFNEEITIRQQGVYQIILENNLGARICDLKITRKNTSGSGLSTEVKWEEIVDTIWTSYNERYLDTTIYEAKEVQPKQNFYLNSATNLGGQTRTTLPVVLPANTVEWYYVYSCSRDKDEINTVGERINLLGDLAELLASPAAGGIASLSAQVIAKPPGGNQCDIYLFNNSDINNFRNKTGITYIPEGTRENFKSGVVRVKNAISSDITLGIKNADWTYGIHVVIEVVAITKEDVYKIREKKRYTIETKRVPTFTRSRTN